MFPPAHACSPHFLSHFSAAPLLDEQDNQGNTSLHAAASVGNSEVYEYLVEKGGDASITNSRGLCPSEIHETFKRHTD